MIEHEPLPDNLPEIASIRISVVMNEVGTGTSFSFEGLSLEAAIGYMTVVLDRMKDDAAAAWDTCAVCGCDLHEEDEDEEN